VRAYAADGHPPATILDRVNTLMWHFGPLAMTTAVYAVLDPAAETLELVSAGHPPPLVISPSGAAAYLEPQSGPPLGVDATAIYAAQTFRLPTGAILLLYTDGLVERRGESIDVGLERLRVLGEGFRDVEVLCASVVERLVGDEPGDDVAFIAARVPPLTDHLEIRRPATAVSLADLRYLLRRWLRSRGAGDEETYEIVVACQEACANAVEHAYGPAPAEIELEAVHADGRVTLTVSDHGRWRPPRGENRGRGLPMMRTLMDTVDVRQTADGTDVVLTRRLGTATA
jgi:anti-sigma regulatory factor (Ser/Thr protein kinase)